MELTEELIKRRSKQFDLGCITLLDLSHAGLARLANLDDCVHVIQLNLSNNQIAEVDGLPVLKALQSLNLASNRLTSIDDLPCFPALEELVLSENQITSLDLKTLALRLPRLCKLDIANNPVETKTVFLGQLRAAFPNLLTLNGEALELHEVLSQAPTTTTNAPALSCVSPLKSSSTTFKLLPFDAHKFAAESTKRLEAMLCEAQQTLETESQRVEKAFGLLEA